MYPEIICSIIDKILSQSESDCSLKDLFTQANEELNRGNYQQAREILDQIVTANSKKVMFIFPVSSNSSIFFLAHIMLAQAFSRSGDHEHALTDLLLAIKAMKKMPEYLQKNSYIAYALVKTFLLLKAPLEAQKAIEASYSFLLFKAPQKAQEAMEASYSLKYLYGCYEAYRKVLSGRRYHDVRHEGRDVREVGRRLGSQDAYEERVWFGVIARKEFYFEPGDPHVSSIRSLSPSPSPDNLCELHSGALFEMYSRTSNRSVDGASTSGASQPSISNAGSSYPSFSGSMPQSPTSDPMSICVHGAGGTSNNAPSTGNVNNVSFWARSAAELPQPPQYSPEDPNALALSSADNQRLPPPPYSQYNG